MLIIARTTTHIPASPVDDICDYYCF